MHRRTASCRSSFVAMLAFAAAAVVGVGIVLAALMPTSPVLQSSHADLASVRLLNDAGSALFTERDLSGGRAVTRCLVVSYTGPAGGGPVRLVAEDLSGTLVPYLRVTVAVGTGGSNTDCSGFTGSAFYAGPLTGLATGTAASAGVATGWDPSDGASRTYALTVLVANDNNALGASGTAAFRWFLPAESVRPPLPTTPSPVQTDVVSPPIPSGPAPSSAPASPSSTSPSSTSPSSTSPSSTSPSSTSPSSTSPSSTSPSSTSPSSTSPSSGPAVPGTAPTTAVPGPGNPDVPAASKSRISRALTVVARIAAGTARHSSVLLVSLAIVLLFLLLQDRIDRRDPKLAQAPLVRHRFSYFGDRPQELDEEEEDEP